MIKRLAYQNSRYETVCLAGLKRDFAKGIIAQTASGCLILNECFSFAGALRTQFSLCLELVNFGLITLINNGYAVDPNPRLRFLAPTAHDLQNRDFEFGTADPASNPILLARGVSDELWRVGAIAPD